MKTVSLAIIIGVRGQRASVDGQTYLQFSCLYSYVPWNLHEPERGKFDFSGNLDLEYVVVLVLLCLVWDGKTLGVDGEPLGCSVLTLFWETEDWVWILVRMLRKALNSGPGCSPTVTYYPGLSAYRFPSHFHYSAESQGSTSHQTPCWGSYTWDGIGLLLGAKFLCFV